jgi:hypothetical protein
MPSDSYQAILLDAVPSFQARWREHCEDWASYVTRHPEEALSATEQRHDFFSELASHVGERLAAGDLSEAEPLFAALDRVYRGADEELATDLTIGFLEDLIDSSERCGADAAALHGVTKGPAADAAWRRVYTYIHPDRAKALGWPVA